MDFFCEKKLTFSPKCNIIISTSYELYQFGESLALVYTANAGLFFVFYLCPNDITPFNINDLASQVNQLAEIILSASFFIIRK